MAKRIQQTTMWKTAQLILNEIHNEDRDYACLIDDGQSNDIVHGMWYTKSRTDEGKRRREHESRRYTPFPVGTVQHTDIHQSDAVCFDLYPSASILHTGG